MAVKTENAIIIDNGSYEIKAGFSTDKKPQYIFPAMVGVLREHLLQEQYKKFRVSLKDYYIGHEALAKRGILCIRYPLENGIITNWDQMEKLWHHTFYSELHAAPEEHSILLTEPPLNPKANRERMIEMMFESFRVPTAYVANQASLALHASGDTTGIVMDAGFGVIRFVPIVEGNVLPHAVHQMNLGGRDLANYLMRIQFEAGAAFHSAGVIRDVRDVMARVCYVASDFEKEMSGAAGNAALKKDCELSNGEIIIMGTERFRCPEVLFKPSLAELETPSIQENIASSIAKCDASVQEELYTNIVLAGGASSFAGIADRLQKELTALAPTGSKVNIKSPPDRKFSAWIGGSMLSSLPTLSWITKGEYEEVGVEIVNRKCAQ